MQPTGQNTEACPHSMQATAVMPIAFIWKWKLKHSSEGRRHVMDIHFQRYGSFMFMK
jgi:hypothetical protein